MHPIKRTWQAVGRALVLVALTLAILLVPQSAVAAKKKKKEEAAPTKSYVLPYMIVMAMIGVGLMTICRPSSRADKLEDTKMNKVDDEE